MERSPLAEKTTNRFYRTYLLSLDISEDGRLMLANIDFTDRYRWRSLP
jgi:hypothetical protein